METDFWLIVLLLLGIGALWLQLGEALYATGQARSKNAAASVVRCIGNIVVSTLAFWAIGASLLLSKKGRLLGLDASLLAGRNSVQALTIFFYMTLVMWPGAIVAGVIAERSKFRVVLASGAVLAGIAVPIVGHWVWSDGGWLKTWHFVDVAGAGVLHLSAAVAGIVAAAFVGPRAGKYNKDGSATNIPGHSLPLVALGAVCLFVGWFPYVLGLAIGPGSLTAGPIDILLAAAGGGAGGLLYSHFRYSKPDVFLTIGGFLGGLVSITAVAGSVGEWSAILIGLIGGLLVPLAILEFDLRQLLDDPSGGIAIHGVGGLWGLLAAGIFRGGTGIGWLDHIESIGCQLIGAVAIIAFVAICMAITMLLLRATGNLRQTDTDEFDGLDLAEHDINAYPDFQQTTIKSYHLREA